MEQLIPNLPDEIARECLIRASYQQFPLMSSVCKLWKREISLPDFLRHRKASGHSQELVILCQAEKDPVNVIDSRKYIPTPEYWISVLELGSGLWTELPPIPGQINGLPLFCGLASAGSDLVVLGGTDPVTWQTSNSVFIFSFLTYTWRNGTSMPGGLRKFFACASDSRRNVFVAGGRDDDRNVLMSALMYDVLEDEWTLLPDMARARAECTTIFHAGKFYVIAPFTTGEQGQFSRTVESFDVATLRWSPQEKDFLFSEMSMWPCAVGENGDRYACSRSDLMVLRGDTWEKVGDLPADVCYVSYITLSKSGKLILIGSAWYGKSSIEYYWDMSNNIWIKLKTHQEYEGHIQAGCFLEI